MSVWINYSDSKNYLFKACGSIPYFPNFHSGHLQWMTTIALDHPTSPFLSLPLVLTKGFICKCIFYLAMPLSHLQ